MLNLKALGIAPSDPAAMLGLATVYLNNHNTKAGIQMAQAAFNRSPDDPELNLLMAQGLMAEHEYAGGRALSIEESPRHTADAAPYSCGDGQGVCGNRQNAGGDRAVEAGCCKR